VVVDRVAQEGWTIANCNRYWPLSSKPNIAIFNTELLKKSYPALFMKGLRGAFPGFVLGAKKATGGLREDGKILKGSFSDKNAARDSLRADIGRTYPQG
jgi:hypothetical protein